MTNQTVSPTLQPLAAKPRLPGLFRWRQRSVSYLFVLPYFLVMLAFGIGPGLYALLISFADFKTGLPKYFWRGV